MRCMHRPDKQIGWPTIAGLGVVVVAFMALSLCVTATGTARFAVDMGYDARMWLRRGRHLRPGQGRPSCGSARAAGPACIRHCRPPRRRLGLPRGLQLPGNARDRQHGHLGDRAHRHLEDGSARQRQGGAGLGRAAACRPEPTRAATASQDRARGLGRRARALRRLEGQPGVRQPSRKASTSPRRAPRSSSCAASWRRPRTTSSCPRALASCARAWQRLPSSPPRTRFLQHSRQPWAACCQSVARKAWRSCSPWSSRS